MLGNLLSLGVLYLVRYESNKGKKKKCSNIEKYVNQKLSIIRKMKLMVICVLSPDKKRLKIKFNEI